MIKAEQIIEKFDMKPLAREGGFYTETYRCSHMLQAENLPNGYAGARSMGTAILYLLTPETLSLIHRICSDEVFHFYMGDPVTMLHLYEDGSGRILTLGQDLDKEHQIQVTVPAGTWQGCILEPGGDFALMGTTVTPGFDFEDFELGGRKQLLCEYPEYAEIINRLTR